MKQRVSSIGVWVLAIGLANVTSLVLSADQFRDPIDWHATDVTNNIRRFLLEDRPANAIRTYANEVKMPSSTLADILKGIVAETLDGQPGVELSLCDAAIGVMGNLRLPNCQPYLMDVAYRPNKSAIYSTICAITSIGGSNALQFAERALSVNGFSSHDRYSMCKRLWMHAARFENAGPCDEEEAKQCMEFIVTEPFADAKINGAVAGDREWQHLSACYRLSADREKSLRFMVARGADKDGYFADQLAGLLAERHVKESGGLSITNEGGYVTNVPRPSTVSASSDTGAIAVVSRPVVEPVTNGGVTTPGATVETASPPRASSRVWIVFGCAAAILALLAALAVRRRSRRC